MNSRADLVYILGALVCTLMVAAETIRGTPGVDYPNYTEIPKTSFRCSEQKYIPGFYADVETQCQVFHFCFENRHESFSCPTGMIFNQKILGCDFWYTSNCSLAPSFYSVNASPVIDKARKRISGLLKMQDASGDNAQASTSSVFQKISSLYDPSTEQASLTDLAAGNIVSESPNDKQMLNLANEQKLQIMQEDSVDKGSTNVTDVLESLIAGFDKIKSKEKLENEGNSVDVSKKSMVDVDDSGEYVAQFLDEFVYDPVSKQYIGTKYYPSLINWDYENEEYGDDILVHGVNQPENIFDNGVDDLDEVEKEKVKLSKIATSDQNNFYTDEFSKRVLPAHQQSVSSRRKPVYVVLDDPDENISFEHKGSSDFLEPTESSYYSSSISIDDLVSQSTEVPVQRRSEENSETFARFPDFTDGVEEIEAESPDVYDFPDGSEVSQSERKMTEPESDFLPFKYDEPTLPLKQSREIMQEYFEHGDPLYSDTEAVDSLGGEDSDDIQILLDENEPNMLPESIADQTEFNTDYSREEDFPYMYAISRETPGNLYENADVNVQDSESEETDGYDPYVQWMGQRYVQYSPQSSRYLPPHDALPDQPQSSQDLPSDDVLTDHYQFMLGNQDGRLQPYFPGVSYDVAYETDPEHSPRDTQTAGYMEGSEYYSDRIPLEEPGADSYDYGYSQPDMQQMAMNGYPYNEEYGYAYNADGVPYYENDFYDETRVVPMGESAESESNSEPLSEQAETTEYNSEPEADGKMNAESWLWDSAEVVADTGSEDVELGLPDLTEIDRVDVDGQEKEIYYLVDTDEEAASEADEFSYDPATLDYTGEYLASNYPQEKTMDNLNTPSQMEYDLVEPSENANEADTKRIQHGQKIPLSANESKSDSPSVSHASFLHEDKEHPSDSYQSGILVNSDLFRNKNSENKEPVLPYHTLESKEKLSSPAVEKLDFTGLEPAKESFGDFVSPGETFMSDMTFPNAMGFNPYGYSTLNMQPPFGMVDSINTAPFTKKNGNFDKENIDQTRLSKLSSLKDKVLSMKRGKFGMFKKSLKTL